MNFSLCDNSVVFLLGAGFNVDAASEAGNPMAPGHAVGYPLVSELGDVCFGLDALPPDKSIEDIFQESIDRGEHRPLDILYDILMEADYYIASRLRRDGAYADNTYLSFFRDFTKTALITFNYDSLPEILLLGERSWRPEDGYGVPVQAELRSVREESLVADCSLRPVLHLHGSLCIYPATFCIDSRPGSKFDMLKFKDVPDFLFDPDALGHCFHPFERVAPNITYTHVADRVIAPVPNKAEGLKSAFIEVVYRQAVNLFRGASQIVAIGYSFNPNDRASYARLLPAAAGRRILVVAPDAGSLVKRLRHDYTRIQWEGEPLSFKEWVRTGYPGVHSRECFV